MSIIINTVRATISTWLRANGVNPQEWAPWVAMDHYLSRKGTDLDLSGDRIIVDFAALAIKRQLEYNEKQSKRYPLYKASNVCNYNTGEIPMQTTTPFLGSDLTGRFNELTATVGGFSFTDEGDHYQIVDRYDWYNTGVVIELPTCIRPLVDKAPMWARQKAGLTGYTLNQGAMPMFGKAFNTVIRVPKDLVDSIQEYDLWMGEEDITVGNNSTSPVDTVQDWDQVFVEDWEDNKDSNWDEIGRGRSLTLVKRFEDRFEVIEDDLFGGFQMPSQLCCLLTDKPCYSTESTCVYVEDMDPSALIPILEKLKGQGYGKVEFEDDEGNCITFRLGEDGVWSC